MCACLFYTRTPFIPQLALDDTERGNRGRGGRRPPRGRKNTLDERPDRHSATGMMYVVFSRIFRFILQSLYSDTEKRVQQSWGGTDGKVELKVEQEVTKDLAAEGDWAGLGANTDDPWGGPPPAASDPIPDEKPAIEEGVKSGEREGRRRDEEEDDTLTLDQYLAKKSQEEAQLVPKLEGARPANEGDNTNWDDVVELKKPGDKAYFIGKVRALSSTTLLTV
jgi:plasminogen activator inhibitor 1 RNA-binding protein